jgi:hypothetical protein
MNPTRFLIPVVCALLPALASCSDDDQELPGFTTISITPEQSVYHVGDVITCSITETKAAPDGLKAASYWWYASWWFTDSTMTADFQDFDDNKTCTSSQITLTKAGDVTLYFFGRLEYPKFDYRKVEIARTITVVE